MVKTVYCWREAQHASTAGLHVAKKAVCALLGSPCIHPQGVAAGERNRLGAEAQAGVPGCLPLKL